MVEALKEREQMVRVGEFQTCFHHLCFFFFYLWQNPNLRSAGNKIEEDSRKDSPASVPFVTFVLSLMLCLATRTCFSVARVRDVMVNELCLFRNCCVSIWWFFCTFFLLSAIKEMKWEIVCFFIGWLMKSFNSLRKQPSFGDATTGFTAKWQLRSEPRISTDVPTRSG